MVKFILQELKWKSVHIVYSAGSYGEHGYMSFISAVKERSSNICIVDQQKITAGESVIKLRAVMRRFYSKESDVKGVVCYCEIPDVKNLLQAIKEEHLEHHFSLIGSDTWFAGVTANHSIIFSLHYNATDTKDFYDTWYRQLTPNKVNSKENPWFDEFWNYTCKKFKQRNNSTTLDCSDFSTNSSFGLCRTDTMELTCRKDDKIPYTIDAVYSFAYAISTSFSKEFNNNKALFLKSLNKLNGSYFLNQYLKKVEFPGVAGTVVKFPENDSVARGFYDLNQFNDGVLEVIGHWKSGVLTMKKSWQENNREKFGKSSCQQDCSDKIGYRRVSKSECCWTCEQCKPNEYLSSKYECTICGEAFKPNLNSTGCLLLHVKHINIIWTILICVIAICGAIITTFTIVTFFRFNDTPLVKASGRELTYVLLFGILSLYCVPFTLIAYPTPILCGIARFCTGFCLCICYGSLLVKTNRIARIFSGRQELLFLTPNWQLILTAMLIMPQILISSIGLVKDTPDAAIEYIPLKYGIARCNSDTIDLIGAIAYNLILVASCTFYAFRTRKVPANFNEARYIGFVMYTTCVIWLAFLPVFFGTSSEYKTIFIMLDMIINATTLLVGLFGIKMYIILLRPDKNSRSNSKLRSVTFFSEGDVSNGTVHVEGNLISLFFVKSRNNKLCEICTGE